MTLSPGAALRARRSASVSALFTEPCTREPPGSHGGTPGGTRVADHSKACVSRSSTPRRSASRAAASTAAMLVAEPSTPTSTGPLMTTPPSLHMHLRTGEPCSTARRRTAACRRPHGRRREADGALSDFLTPRSPGTGYADRGRPAPRGAPSGLSPCGRGSRRRRAARTANRDSTEDSALTTNVGTVARDAPRRPRRAAGRHRIGRPCAPRRPPRTKPAHGGGTPQSSVPAHVEARARRPRGAAPRSGPRRRRAARLRAPVTRSAAS